MNMKSIFLTLCVLSFNLSRSFAQDNDTYQLPPKAIADLLLAKPTPLVRIDSKAEYLLLLGRNSYPSVEELGQPEMKIAGLRLNPLNFSPSRQSPISSITLQVIKSGATYTGPQKTFKMTYPNDERVFHVKNDSLGKSVVIKSDGKEEVRIGLNGIHVKDGKEEVHVDWNGVQVKVILAECSPGNLAMRYTV